MSVTQNALLAFTCDACINWNESSLFQTIQVCHKSFASYVINEYIFVCTISALHLSIPIFPEIQHLQL